jgi:hypothetical protein
MSMGPKDYPKQGQAGSAAPKGAHPKQVSEHYLAYGEPVELPGGVSAMRKYDRGYEKGVGSDPDDMGTSRLVLKP